MATVAPVVPPYRQKDYPRIAEALSDDEYMQYMALGQKQKRHFLENAPMDVLANIEMRQSPEGLVPPPGSEDPVRGQKGLGTPTGATREEFLTGKGFGGTGLEEFGPLKDPGYDYSGLSNMGLRAGLSLMETKQEKENFLTQNIGPGSFTTDSQGRYAIMPAFREKAGAPPGSEPLVIDAPQSGFQEVGGDIADVAGAAPEVIASAGVGMAATGYGALPAAVASGVAAGAAQAIEEGVEALYGYQLQSLDDVALDVTRETGYGLGGELFGRLLARTGKFIASPGEIRVPTEKGVLGLQKYEYGARAGESSQQITGELLDEGAIPDPYMATKRELLGRFSGLVSRVFGYNRTRDIANRRWFARNREERLGAVGADELPPLTRLDKLTDEQVGDLLQASRQGKLTGTQTALKNIGAQVKSATNSAITRLKKATGKYTPNLGEDLIRQLSRAKEEFSTAVGRVYHEADELLGAAPTIPTQRLRATAKQIYAQFPREADGSISKLVPTEVQQILESLMNTPHYIKASEMYQYRSMLGDLAYSPELLGNVKLLNLNRLKIAADRSFDDAIENNVRVTPRQEGLIVDERGYPIIKKGEDVVPLTKVEQDRLALGVKKLREAKTAYAEGMTRFDNVVVKRMARESGEAGSIEAEVALPYLIKNNNPANLQFFLNALPDDVTRATILGQLRRGHFEETLTKALDPESGQVSARRLLIAFKNLGRTGRPLYGDEYTSIMGQLQQLARAQGKLSPQIIEELADQPGQIPALLRKQFKLQQEEDLLLKETWSKKLADTSSPEVLDWLVRKASIKEIRQAKEFFGPESTEFRTIQRRSMQNILDSIYHRSDENPVEMVLNGRAFLEEIENVGLPKLRELFGEDLAQGLHNYAKKASFLTSKPKGLSGGLVAASIALNPLDHLGTLLRLKILGQLLSSPTSLRWLTNIVENPGSRTAARAATRLSGQISAQLLEEPESARDPEAATRTEEILNNMLQGSP